ncbi:uncharacterized protein FIBRA_06272 [Fibroporia radiculosa]|uniref:GH16 domain-containing protein n=1 Tax=Fibroporia radiculosa TaxID=599839 RepID=J4HYU9_9APHY|nr:uncharacterized protein FIBRA_06272 [Fibroporia radiculosa]CCM04112.1 predicted protein [Fibroporia radiculosa]
MKIFCLGLLVFPLTHGVLGAYNLVQEYSGQSFFEGWDFYGAYDNTTLGDVFFVTEQTATTLHLAYVNSAGNAIIRVDNTTSVPSNQKRNSVYISTATYFPIGSVFIIDLSHIPYGCSVWPAFWTKGADWPTDGEIDIIETVNLVNNNQYALHTGYNGCVATNVGQTGTLANANCTSTATSDVGCTFQETQANSVGSGFNSAGGGVYATQFDVSGVYIWFWSRANIPSSISSSTTSVNTSSWGSPSAAFPATDSCDISKFVAPQQLVLDITLCGSWAGLASVYQETCPVNGTAGLNTCYDNNVIDNGTPAYAEAYFEISYVKVFSLNETSTSTSSSTSSSGSASTLSSTSTSGSPTSSSSASTTSTTKASGAIPIVQLRSTAAGVFAAMLTLSLIF